MIGNRFSPSPDERDETDASESGGGGTSVALRYVGSADVRILRGPDYGADDIGELRFTKGGVAIFLPAWEAKAILDVAPGEFEVAEPDLTDVE